MTFHDKKGMIKPKEPPKEYMRQKKVVSALVIIIILIAVLSYGTGVTFGSSTTTVASTTVTQDVLQTTTSLVTLKSITTNFVIQTTTQFVTITQQGPDLIKVTGSAMTKGVGTSPTKVLFVSVKTDITYQAPVKDGNYTTSLNNRDYYNVFIEFSSLTGGGKCSAGALVGWFLTDPPRMNWSC